VAVKRFAVVANPNTDDGSWSVAANGSTKVRIQAQQAGEASNTAANTIRAMENQISHVTAVTNELPIINGQDEADDDTFRQYFHAWLLSLGGATRGGVLFRVLNYVDPTTGTKPVHSAALEEWGGTNLLGGGVALKVWIEDGTGTASSTLIEAIQVLLDGRDTQAEPGIRGAGVPALVVAANPVNIPVDVAVDLDRSVDSEATKKAVKTAIEKFLIAVPVSGTKITGESQGQVVFAQLFKAVLNVDGVLRAVFTRPARDQNLNTGQKAMPGTVTVTVASVT